MLVTLGWMLFAILPPNHFTSPHDGPVPLRHLSDGAAGRVSVWADREDPYARGDGVRIYLSVAEPSYVAVFRVDTDGRVRVLFPVDPRTGTYLDGTRQFELAGGRGPDRTFIADDDPGMGYVFALAAAAPLDFRSIIRGDRWDDRLVDGGRIRGDPYVALTDLAARLVPDGDYDYDVSPYYVGRRYDYPRFVCYDCHAAASYDEWNPYGAPCSRYRVVVRDDPRYYPYRYGGGRNVVADRPAHPGPRFLFRDADPRLPAVSLGEPGPRSADDDRGRTSVDIGGRGSVPAPLAPSLRRRDLESAPERSPARPLIEARGRAERRREEADERGGRRERADTARDAPRGLRPTRDAPRSTGEPELRRRRR